MPPAVVLVTGVSRWLGGALAAELAADPSIERVIGVDTVPPAPEMLRRLGRTEFVRADIRNPLIGKVIASASVDTVVHMNISSTPAGSGGRAPMKELNVIGTMQLLAACQRAPSVRAVRAEVDQRRLRRLVARPRRLHRDDAGPQRALRRLREGQPRHRGLRARPSRRRRPDVDVVVLRFTNFIGPRIDSLLTGFFRMPVVPTALGYDARVQLLHEDDALAVLTRATTGDFVGTVNVGGEGTLLLSQAIRRLGRVEVPLPTPALGSVGRLSRRARLRRLLARADALPQLRPRRGHHPAARPSSATPPRYTTEAALADYARTVRARWCRRGSSSRATSRARSLLATGRRHRRARSATGCGRHPPASRARGRCRRCLQATGHPAAARRRRAVRPAGRRTPRLGGPASPEALRRSCAAG